ncbi:hypothetical protein D9757_009246 [Collybiopsis confluens]|uniref:Uncharacterized protein n=1 Tax=Collybiopsis confluens TaxID=2823264 RepID=A0A8H5HA70_9AGAR|nr:hypothetical protein D9757_009246 [Collybiopsis confluens]
MKTMGSQSGGLQTFRYLEWERGRSFAGPITDLANLNRRSPFPPLRIPHWPPPPTTPAKPSSQLHRLFFYRGMSSSMASTRIHKSFQRPKSQWECNLTDSLFLDLGTDIKRVVRPKQPDVPGSYVGRFYKPAKCPFLLTSHRMHTRGHHGHLLRIRQGSSLGHLSGPSRVFPVRPALAALSATFEAGNYFHIAPYFFFLSLSFFVFFLLPSSFILYLVLPLIEISPFVPHFSIKSRQTLGPSKVHQLEALQLSTTSIDLPEGPNGTVGVHFC